MLKLNIKNFTFYLENKIKYFIFAKELDTFVAKIVTNIVIKIY